MDDDCLIVSEDIRSAATKSLKVNPHMKTKQARLPFVRIPVKSRDATQVESSKTTSAAGRKESKKRKHSGSSQALVEQPKSKKRTTTSSSVSKKRASPEVEVSSSSDEVNVLAEESSDAKPSNASQKSSSSTKKRPKSPPTARTSAFLQKFVKKKPTQQDEVSTSVGDTPKKDAISGSSNASCMDLEEEVRLNGNEEGDTEDDEKKVHLQESNKTNKSEALTETKSNSILEAIEIAINKKKPSVNICSDEKDAAEKELTCQRKKRKLSCDSGKSLKSEKENVARPPSPKKSKNLLTAFIQRGIKSSPEASKIKEASSSSKNGERLGTSPEASKQSASDVSSDTSYTAREDESDISKSKVSDPEVPKEQGKASNVEADEAEDEKNCSSSSNENETSSLKEPNNDDYLKEEKSPCRDAEAEKTPVRSRARNSGRDGESKSSGSETKKLTPKSQAKLAEKKQREELRLMKQEEKMKQKQEKEEEKAKKEAERLKVKEEKKAELEKQRKEKEEQKKKKQEELDAKSKEREEKRKKIEEEKRVKEEEKRAKEEEKRVKEEEKKKAEQEEKERKKKVAEKFANFFKAGKEEPSGKTIAAKDHHSGPFQQMQVSRYTALAPIQRASLSEESRASLDEHIASSTHGSLVGEMRAATYLEQLRAGDHKPSSSPATPPAIVQKDDKDECVIIEQEADDEDEEDDDLEYTGEGMVVCEKTAVDPKNHKGKLLKFCENRRPAYWGTWTKKPTAVRPRRPFAKEEIFDYEYDSDDDWEEEEENGESLSDSEGEKEEEEDEQYEVDNDFFVPHGYLSDDEGQDDEEHLDGSDGARNEAEPKESTGLLDNKEKLKAKQAEFEKELKKQTKQLKPRVLGCLWLHEDEQCSDAAFDHLHRVMSGYSAVVCLPPPDDHAAKVDPGVQADVAADKSLVDGVRSWYLTFPGIPCLMPATPQPDLLVTPSITDACDTPLPSTGLNGSQKRKFFKTFPEEAIPSLIRLMHGNRNGQQHLVKEFSHYWHKLQQREHASERQDTSATPTTSLHSPYVELSKKKIKDKLIELASYRRCPDEGPFFNQNMWYVDASVRKQHGVKDASLPNEWSYCTALPKANRMKEDCSSAGEPPHSKATPLISKFTKVLSDEEKAVLIAKKSSDKNASRDNAANDDEILEIKHESAGGSEDKAPMNGKKNSQSVKTANKISPKSNPGKTATPTGRKASKSSLKSTPSSSPLLAFFNTRNSGSKKTDSKSPRIKAKDDCPDAQCITLD